VLLGETLAKRPSPHCPYCHARRMKHAFGA
jgi:hypothetical protein